MTTFMIVLHSTFLDQYKSGHTPNPDVLCNLMIKFTAFYNHVMTSLKATAIATGHYAQLHRNSTGGMSHDPFHGYLGYVAFQVVKLLQSVDTFKDQSYFLCQVPQVMLASSPWQHHMASILFPRWPYKTHSFPLVTSPSHW